MDTDGKIIMSVVVGFLIVLFSLLFYNNYQRGICIRDMKDKSAAEIQVVCGRL